MENFYKICIIDEYNNKEYVKCISAGEILNIIDDLEFYVEVYKYNEYYKKNEIEKCDYVLKELIF